MELNRPAPDFVLTDLDGNSHSLADSGGRILILNFWSAECPHAARVDLDLLPLVKQWGDDVHLLQIASNGNESPELLRQVSAARGVMPLLLDADHQVADLYEAKTTPHIFIIDGKGFLRYEGAYDDVTFRQRTATRNYVREAIERLLKGKRVQITRVPPFGCTIVRMNPLRDKDYGRT